MIQVKNLTQNNVLLDEVNKLLLVGETFDISDVVRPLWANSDQVISAITSDQIRVVLSGEEIVEYSKQIKILLKESLAPLDANGNPIVAIDNPKSPVTGSLEVSVLKQENPSVTKCTHDLSDKTTWYTESVRVVEETLTLSVGFTYTSTNTFWIDLTHGKVYDEDFIVAGGDYDIIITVDDTPVNSGFTIDYVNGTVTFDADPSGVVKATYNYATGSTWRLVPDPGKAINIEHSEIQFTEDVKLLSSTVPSKIFFEIWVYNPLDLPNKVLYRRNIYKSGKDIIAASNLGFSVPKFDDLPLDVNIYPFNYVSLISLSSSVGAELRVSTENDVPLEGSWAVGTFYISIKGE